MGRIGSPNLEELLSGLALIIDGGSATSTMKWVLLWSLLDSSPLLAAAADSNNVISLAPVAHRRIVMPARVGPSTGPPVLR